MLALHLAFYKSTRGKGGLLLKMKKRLRQRQKRLHFYA